MSRRWLILVGLCALPVSDVLLWASTPRVMKVGELPKDRRLQPLKDLDGYFPFQVSDTPVEWQRRAERQRTAIKVALGLWPMPTRLPPKAVIHGKRDLGDYTVEKVYLQSFPQFYVTGNLYRPKGEKEACPAVLCPHGHFPDGRFGVASDQEMRQLFVQGAERFDQGGRNCIQARCVQLARMGCVVFQYDMVGYCDSHQISYELAHRFGRQRLEMIGGTQWGFFSPQAESNLQSVMGLQTYNSIRVLDWIETLPDVDSSRIAVTGASGGGTQTFILCAIDPRPAVAIPAVMVSTAMQGGCTCENASLLRVGRGNVEFAALFAPRPLCLLSANDWTVEMKTKGYPELAQHYRMLGAQDQIVHHPLLHFGHNYNYVSRARMYDWINRQFDLKHETPIVEQNYDLLSADQLSVWDDDHPRPENGPAFERRLLRWWADDATSQLFDLTPTDSKSLERYRAVVSPAINAILGRSLPDLGQVEFDQKRKDKRSSHWLISGLLRNHAHDECVPILFIAPNDWQGAVAIWLDEKGKGGLYQGSAMRPAVRRLVDHGVAVVGVDLLMQGEFLANGETHRQTRRVKNPREAAAYTLGYNDSLFVSRVHDVLSVTGFVLNHERKPDRVFLIGLDGMGPLAAAARAQAGEAIDRAVVDTRGFRFQQVRDIRDPNLLPGGAKYFDLPGLLSMSAPYPILVAGEDEMGVWIARKTFTAANATENLQLLSGENRDLNQAAVDWLLAE
ncbi:MAG: alpha/beta hydrolase family protein [Pirellulaceae bacterium]|nr:alpha/beta hydrolase family protein [Pirellulaceae bacterium]